MIKTVPDIQRYFKEDIAAAFGLAFVVLPIALGIGVASGTTPIAGVLSAIVGGIVATFFRGSHVTINGPSAGLIGVMLMGGIILSDGGTISGFNYLLAATILAGIGQLLLGVLRFAEIIDRAPSASINGMLAAVGLTIIGTQFHTILGVSIGYDSAFDCLCSIPSSFLELNPIVTSIGLMAVAVMVLHDKISIKAIEVIPAPIWVILFSLPIVYYFDFFETHYVPLFGEGVRVAPEFLVDIPENFKGYWVYPDFGKINTFSFWMVSLSILVISTIETLVSAKVVDRLDPLKRHSNLNKELVAVGISSIVAGAIGGLPVITAIPVYSGAKTKWANLYYGLILLLFVVLFDDLLRIIPLSALAVLLVYTGYKMAKPQIWVSTYKKGDDQFLTFLTTLLATLVYDLLIGLGVGIITTLFTHFVKSNLTRKQFFQYLRDPSIESDRNDNTHERYIRLKGIVNFINIPTLKKILRYCAKTEKHIIVDMSHTRLADYTVLEYLQDYAPRYDLIGVTFEIVGLGAHDATSRHPNATRILSADKKPQLNQRQRGLKELTEEKNGSFWPEVRWDFNQLKDFELFKGRGIEYTINTAKGHYKMFFEWETCDITFGESRLFSNKGRHTSVAILHLPFNAPSFVLQEEILADRIGVKLALREEDINFDQHPSFSNRFLLQGDDKEGIRKFFNDVLIKFLNDNPYYQLECNGAMLLILKDMRFSSPLEMRRLHEFSQQLAEILLESWKSQPLDLEALL
ncbi:MAG: SulP family inorganic anion transporter [Aureispira sp.]